MTVAPHPKKEYVYGFPYCVHVYIYIYINVCVCKLLGYLYTIQDHPRMLNRFHNLARHPSQSSHLPSRLSAREVMGPPAVSENPRGVGGVSENLEPAEKPPGTPG